MSSLLPDPNASLLDRIKTSMVGLKMPRAIEVVDACVSRLDHGEITALEAIEQLLLEELTFRENRRIKTALVMGRLGSIKTLAGYDFSFQPSLGKARIMALAELNFVDRCEVVHLLGPPGTGKSHLATALGVEAVKAGKSVYFLTLADLIGALAKAEREGTLRERIRFYCRPALVIVDEIGYLPVVPARRQSVLPAGQRPLREKLDDPYLQPWLCRMGRDLRKPRGRDRTSRPVTSSRHRRSNRRLQLSPAAPRKPLARTRYNTHRTTQTSRSAA